MKLRVFLLLGVFLTLSLAAQKKPLDHSVYNSWESIPQVLVSNDGKYSIHIVAPQEGDSMLYITNLKTQAVTLVERGFSPQITDDSRHVVFRIKPTQEEKKEARKSKKSADDQPQDSLGWVKLGTQDVQKTPKVRSYRMPEKASGYFAYTTRMNEDTTKFKKSEKPDCLVLYYFASNDYDTIPFVTNYTMCKNGNYISYTTKPSEIDSLAVPGVYLYDTKTRKSASLMEGKGDYRMQSFDEDATQFVFYATTDTTKRNPKVFNLYYTMTATPSARLIADTLSRQMPENWEVNTSQNAYFSKDGSKLYFGISPIIAPKDTTIDESEMAKLDIWHYNDDYVQPMQLKQLRSDLNRSYLCVFNVSDLSRFTQLGDEDLESITVSARGDGVNALGATTKGYRIESQWTGITKSDVYIVSTTTGERTLVGKGFSSRPAMSVTGKYLTWFDRDNAQWYMYSVADKTTCCVTEGLDTNFENATNQTPDKPGAYGSMGWSKNDRYFYVYDMYDIWQIDPVGKEMPVMITKGMGRNEKIVFRNIRFDNEIDYIDTDKPLFLSAFNKETKEAGYYTLNTKSKMPLQKRVIDKKTFPAIYKAKQADVYIYSKADFATDPDLWVTADLWKSEKQISQINPQMKDYLWGTAELVSWKSKDGHDLKGILYKPENFDPNKKYPMISYFYERHSDELYRYFSPAPSRSTVNISFFCSRGYLVFTPDIYYIDGYPGRSAYNSIIPGIEKLSENPWVDKARIGIQGQSWGGYQVSYLITQTDMFAAAGAGAPVANMTSAYGGIRWGTGMSRQRQYEFQQSRIGKTMWDEGGFDLYIENSPLFYADKVKTPLLIMHNDNDGAVPWYQGIEYFMALRRLNKIVYLLQYNGEDHNLVHRRNSLDLSVRLQQFFDHYLKGEPMPVWMKTGVPATEKGKTWGL
jgi:Dipeptidyl aminopeptidases/acylaminoacyl-peptidases